MGMRRQYIDFINDSLEANFKKKEISNGLSMVELGDQVINDTTIPFKTGKDYFVSRNFEHISIDLNGLHGSQIRDLRKPDQFVDLNSRFDVLTNLGTTEHVEPFHYQYTCFEIIHQMVKKNGMMIHIVPDNYLRVSKRAWIDHCRIYYSEAFFENLATKCNYEIVYKKYINNLLCVSMIKRSQSFDISEDDFYKNLSYVNYKNKFRQYLFKSYRYVKTNLSNFF